MRKIAVFMADGFEEVEALTVVDYLRRTRAEVTMVSIPVGHSGIPGGPGTESVVVGAHGIGVVTDAPLGEYIESLHDTLPDAVFCPGGMPGAANIAAYEPALNLITMCADAGKVVAAICAAPVVVLAKTGILAGRRYTCYPGMEDGLSKYCGNYEKMAQLMKDSHLVRNVPYVLDGMILTGRGPGTAEEFAIELIRLVAGSDMAKQIHDSTVQR